MQDALDRLVLLYANVCCQGSAELAELELKAELRSQLKLERSAHRPCYGSHVSQCYMLWLLVPALNHIRLSELDCTVQQLPSHIKGFTHVCRTTVWKDMVERERKGHSATVEDFAPGLTSWLQRNRQYLMILLAAAAFAVLLSELFPAQWLSGAGSAR